MFIAINFPLRTAFALSHKFWYVMFPFFVCLKIFFDFSFDFFFDPLVVLECFAQSPHIFEFSSFPPITDL